MKVQKVPSEWVNVTWPMVEPHFAKAIQYSHDGYTLDHIQTLVSTGQWMLVVVTDDDNKICGALTLVFFNRPMDRVAFITALAGKTLFSDDTTAQLKALVASHGATVIEGAVRESVARLATRYGFSETSRHIKLKL